tara:strand:- start:1073 stop:1195 length:123 start_codon:yes stop_codon:yes gene_type:complete
MQMQYTEAAISIRFPRLVGLNPTVVLVVVVVVVAVAVAVV